MESFATAYPVIFNDGEEDQDKGQIGIHSVLSFKKFQAQMSRIVGLPPNQLSTVFVCRRTARETDKRQKLPINETTNFNIILNQHNPSKERDCHFLVSVKKSKKERKGTGRKRSSEVDEEGGEDASPMQPKLPFENGGFPESTSPTSILQRPTSPAIASPGDDVSMSLPKQDHSKKQQQQLQQQQAKQQPMLLRRDIAPQVPDAAKDGPQRVEGFSVQGKPSMVQVVGRQVSSSSNNSSRGIGSARVVINSSLVPPQLQHQLLNNSSNYPLSFGSTRASLPSHVQPLSVAAPPSLEEEAVAASYEWVEEVSRQGQIYRRRLAEQQQQTDAAAKCGICERHRASGAARAVEFHCCVEDVVFSGKGGVPSAIIARGRSSRAGRP